MSIAIFDSDFATAEQILAGAGLTELKGQIARAIAAERERCARLVEEYVCSTANLGPLVDQIRMRAVRPEMQNT